MELYFLRHGLAGQHGDPAYKDDSLRPLTLEGRKKVRLAGQGMKTLGLKFDAIASSPFLRAKQTAEIVARVYKVKNIYLTDNLLPPAPVEKLLKDVRTRFPDAQNILLVGHEPHLSKMVSSLLKCGRMLAIDFKKSGLCCLSVEGPSAGTNAVLNWLLTPAQLGLLAL
jgi:phosphohistidine phosphatase